MEQDRTKVDLHCHSTLSDGSMTPQELVDEAERTGCLGFALTDHDTFDGFLNAKDYAAEKGMWLITGVEISAHHQHLSVHVLGYAFEPNNGPLKEFCSIHQGRRDRRNQQILEKLLGLGMPLSLAEIKSLSPNALAYGRPHIALALAKKGFVPNVPAAFARYLAEGRPCYVSGEKWTVEEAITAVHEAGGMAVLAHPQLIKSASMVRKLLSLPFDGLEAYYGNAPASVNEKWCSLAAHKGLFVTGGSDFHGAVRPSIPFGASWAPQATVELLASRFQQNLKQVGME